MFACVYACAGLGLSSCLVSIFLCMHKKVHGESNTWCAMA